MNKACSVDGCYKEVKDGSKMCGMHCARMRRYGRLHLIRRENGSGNINKAGYIDVSIDGRRSYAHVLVAEKAIGRKLGAQVVVHHVNEIRSDNNPSNLVVCQDDVYHKLLHRRAKAYDACGNANYLRCPQCLIYDDPRNLKRQNTHAACLKAYARARYVKNKGLNHV